MRKARRRSWFWRYRRLLFLVVVLGASAVAGLAWIAVRVPLPADAPQAETTILYDASGAQLAVLHGPENRVAVRIGEVPAVLQQAVLAAEDRNFFRHGGVDPVGIARATWADLRHKGSLQGGSTITQQYVKNVYVGVGRERSLVRKIKEAAIAVKLEEKYDKRAILERYLNTIYFGRGAYGVQAAARAYFAKDVGQLNLAESAYLAGLIRSPVVADVADNRANAEQRRDIVLTAMERSHTITPAQKADAESVPLTKIVVPPSRGNATVALASKGTEYYVDYVRRQLVRDYGEAKVLRGGLRVYTTLDLKLQEQAYDAVYGLLNRASDPKGALVALDPDGRIVAMVGGNDWAASKVNLSLGKCDPDDSRCVEGGGSGRQPGSAFKPFVLAETVREGYSVESSFPGPAQMVFPKADSGKDWVVKNFEDESFGRLNLIDATAHSVNTVYAQLVTAIGPDRVVDMAHRLGIRSHLDPVPSITLGSKEVSVLEMAEAYLSLANEGVHVEPRAVRRVTSGSTVLRDDRSPRNRVLDRSQADVVNFALRQVVEKGTGVGAQVPGRPVWGKTGTTDNNFDAWFVGFTPRLTTAVWMGYPQDEKTPMINVHGVARVNGGSLPATIFSRFMSRALPRDSGSYVVPASFPGRLLGARLAFGDSPSTTVASQAALTSAGATVPAVAPAATVPGHVVASTIVRPRPPPAVAPVTTMTMPPPPVVREPVPPVTARPSPPSTRTRRRGG